MSVDERFEAFRIAVQDQIWSEDDEGPLPVLLKANIDADNRTIFLVVKTGSSKYMIEFGLPVPTWLPNREDIFDLDPDMTGTDEDGPSIEQVDDAGIAEALDATRSWSEAIQIENPGPLKIYWASMRNRVISIFPTTEQYFTSLENYLKDAFHQDPSVEPPTLVDIYTPKNNKRQIVIIITEAGVTHRVDYLLPVPANYPARLFPGKQYSMLLGPEGPTRTVTSLPFMEAGFHSWEQEITRVGEVTGSESRVRLSQALAQFWQESQHNIFVVLRRAGIVPSRRLQVSASGSDPGAVAPASPRRRVTRRFAVSASPLRRHRRTHRHLTSQSSRSKGWLRPRDPRDPLDPKSASSEIGRRVPKPLRS